MDNKPAWKWVEYHTHRLIAHLVRQDGLEDVKRAIGRGDWNYVPRWGDNSGFYKSTIFLQCLMGCAPLELIEAMLKAGANPNYVLHCFPQLEPGGITILEEAIHWYKLATNDFTGKWSFMKQARLLACITAMIEIGKGGPSLTRRGTETALEQAISANQTRGCRSLAQLLLSRGVDPEQIIGGMPAVLWATTRQSDTTIDLLAFGANPFRRCPKEGVSAIGRINRMKEPPKFAWLLRVFEAREKEAMAFLMCWNRLRRQGLQEDQGPQEGPDAFLAALPRDVIKLLFNRIKYANDHCMGAV